MTTLTTSDVKIRNKENIIRFVYEQRVTQQQQICESLGLSRPTVIPVIRELEEQKLFEKNGYFESTGGRKANAIRFVANAKLALGVELLIDRYEISALDLYGETVCFEAYPVEFSNTADYYLQVCDSVLSFIDTHQLSSQKILGVGIVLQGLIAADGSEVTYGEILNCTGLTIDTFSERLPYPCKFFHDAESAAQDEMWQSPKLENAIYINVRSHVSGAIIVNRQFLKGTDLKSGVFEHMTLVPDGKPCYCGKRGCVETYCSTQTLLDHSGSLEQFFTDLRRGDTKCRKQWNILLKHLAACINNLHMFIDYPVIIGGTLAPYLQGSDLTALHKLFNDITAFPSNNEFIYASNCPGSPISRGAALPYIHKYLKELMGNI
ncbi:N-acetylglucosamine repressor [Lachnospiraceae bacterium PM6-15]|uniref:ROK family transcriptional regulator n=1 Tax=Ohessyouella blattaphilus TaxID=2949333 RepID=UPI003E1E910C